MSGSRVPMARVGLSGPLHWWLLLLVAAPWLLIRTQAEPSHESAIVGQVARFQFSVQSQSGEGSAAEVQIWWQRENQNITNSPKYQILVSKSAEGNVTSELVIDEVDWDDAGLYSFVAREVVQVPGEPTGPAPKRQNIVLNVFAPPKVLSKEDSKAEKGKDSEMSCTFKSKPLPEIKWIRYGHEIEENPLKYELTTAKQTDTELTSYLNILNLQHSDNGTYLCHAENEYGTDTVILDTLVMDNPTLKIEFARAVDQDKIYFNWTLQAWNAPVSDYFLSYRQDGEDSWVYFIGEKISTDASSFVMKDLQPNSSYHIKLAAKNRLGMGEFNLFHETVQTLDFIPTFEPIVRVKGLTWNSISIGWNPPTEDRIKEHIDYYKLTRKTDDQELTMYHPAKDFPFYLWRNLEPAKNYSFAVSACSKYTRECGLASKSVSASTEDGLSGPPALVEVFCKHDNISGMNFVDVKWREPKHKYGHIEFYNINLRGVANFFDQQGKTQVELLGPEVKTEDVSSTRTRFDFLKPNTNYTVEVCAVTRSKECGQSTTTSCLMRQLPPRAEHLNRFQWYSEFKSDHHVFRLQMPRMSERNGRICCMRVIVVKLPAGQTAQSLPHQSDLALKTYREVHRTSSASGAYIAEILGSNFMGKDVFIGDGQNILSAGMGGCPPCQTGVRAHLLRAAQRAESRRLNRRSTAAVLQPTELVEDGFLDPEANYTAFVEMVIPDTQAVGRSPYMSPRKPGDPISLHGRDIDGLLVAILGILSGLVFVALALLVALVFLRRYSKKVAATQGGVEMSLRRSFRHLYTTLRGRDHSQYLITPEAPKPEVGPIRRNDLVPAYLDRHKDSDYGFQAEFEQLPDRYPDRTTEVCDNPKNRPKNRYPDIKCYDQTRVKLAEIEDVEFSDYINANYVYGYKERKKWICAQGPLDHTVADFWRMVYEQGVELVIMLTNLEEYNRIKCAQYWPQAGDHNYCTRPVIINVAFCTETRYSDYIVRELLMTVTKGENEKVIRKVFQYHYLQWKDFNAPEHAPGMLKFSKRINEAWKGSSPIAVHCSAGVGRSGTLIAIDSLMQQLDDEGEVKIHKLISEMRHSRNYLVQSAKQYIFVYRAIMELAQFGDTEIKASEVGETWTKMDGKKLEEEFGRLANIVDDRKALSVGANEENKAKNQCDSVIPFDRNRVILTPDGQKPHSTYINASFIEGYNNDESFIITQDPLPSTAEDFWRMVTEHSISTMVMLSGDQSWHYWEEEEATFGNLHVKLVNSDHLPSYVKREFIVRNSKMDEEISLVHFMYSGWKGQNASDVPSVTHGLLDLVEHANAFKTESGLPGPIAIHCKCGSDRSSVYVALSCLVQQIKTEGRADIFTAVRKLRSQRQSMVQHVNQYRFIYKAISDYAELYQSKDEESEYSVPVNAVNGHAK
eukprot:maker-scaffold100_size373717-snap-gene-2.51 protein:Tk05144 transcript:maker-scaffold100_size373717-snap-gene-2.51-mRNA-1 annotation:"receptor-type tyrosine-protein phosphatase alpha"